MNGFTDKPVSGIGDDIFDVKQYISGLCSFITECNTPMTIAIQGDWGSGKTSMMNMIKEQLEQKVATSWFNTWQYSQFNMDDTLTVSLLSRLISDLDTKDKAKNAKVKKALDFIYKFAKTGSVMLTNAVVGDAGAEALNNSLQRESEEMDMPQAIHDLKEQFQAAINAKIEQNKVDRVVIFIDDLDRLHPGKAVELLEVLKLFLDCDNCVFVLAIDYAVVSQGVKQKYGELIGEEKGKSFFDKIIQVPFKMPVAQYNVRNYVITSLEGMGITLTSAEADTFVKLIQTSISCNPRAMKRLFNAFLLLIKVTGVDSSNVGEMKILFAILCLQLSFESIYNYIVTNPAECCDGTLLKNLSNVDTYDTDSTGNLSVELNLTTDAEVVKVVEFMTVFNAVIDADGNKKFSEEEISDFIRILGFSTITASTSPERVSEESPESHYRYFNRTIIKNTLPVINSHCNANFNVYQAKADRENWTKYYAAGKGYLPCTLGNSKGKVGIDYKIATDLQTKESTLSIWIYPADKLNPILFKEKFVPWNDAQTFGLVYLEDDYGFWLDSKKLPSDSKAEISRYFLDIVPDIVNSIENYLSKTEENKNA